MNYLIQNSKRSTFAHWYESLRNSPIFQILTKDVFILINQFSIVWPFTGSTGSRAYLFVAAKSPLLVEEVHRVEWNHSQHACSGQDYQLSRQLKIPTVIKTGRNEYVLENRKDENALWWKQMEYYKRSFLWPCGKWLTVKWVYCILLP